MYVLTLWALPQLCLLRTIRPHRRYGFQVTRWLLSATFANRNLPQHVHLLLFPGEPCSDWVAEGICLKLQNSAVLILTEQYGGAASVPFADLECSWQKRGFTDMAIDSTKDEYDEENNR